MLLQQLERSIKMPSTGPTTPEGKARASLNAVKHGLTAIAMTIPGLENEDDWQTFYDGVFAYYEPVGAVEFALIDRAARLHWRLRRVPRAELDAILNPAPDAASSRCADSLEALEETTRHLSEQFGPPDEFLEQEYRIAEANPAPPKQPRSLPDPLPLLMLSKYEMRLGAQLRHVIREIENCQTRRERGNNIPLYAL
jgi:hypothetical protein